MHLCFSGRGCANVNQTLDMQVFKPFNLLSFKDHLKHHGSKSTATQVICASDDQSLVPGLLGLNSDV
eukprot:1849452-Amphidinium_carterae.1